MSDVIEITSSDEEDNSKGPGMKRATTTTTANNTTNANNARMLSGIKRSNSEEQATVKKRLKTNHVSPNVTHTAFRSQVAGNKSTKPVMGETVMVFDPKSRNLVYQVNPPRQNELKIADVRSIKTLQRVPPKDPLAVGAPVKPSKASVTLPKLSEVNIIPLKSPQTSRLNNQKTPSSPSTSTAPSTSAQNGYTSTPDISIRSVPRITSPVPGSSRTSSMSSPGAASSTSTMTTTNTTDVPKTDENPPPSVNREMNQAFKDMLEVCKASDQSKDMDLITTKLVKYYQRVHPDFVNSPSFIRSVEKATSDIKSQPAQVFWLLRTIVEELQIRQGGTKIADDGEIVTENNEAVTTGDLKLDKKLYKLNKGLYIIQKRIEKLREQDAMWEEENNSTYLVIGKFEKRAVKIYEKICKLTGESIDANRRVKKPIKFNKTKYTEFNKALQSLYNKTHNFPDFYDVLKVLEYCNTQYDYGLKGDAMKVVAQNAFHQLGEKLQSRRKLEEYESLSYLTSLANDDPANHDPELARKLEENKKFQSRIDDVINKFAAGRHIEAEQLLTRGGTKRVRLNSENGASDDSGNDEDLPNGSNPATPQNATNDPENNNNSTNNQPKTPPTETGPTISEPTEISMEPELLTLDNVALLNSIVDGS